jgi:hypothetical protein
MARLSQMTSSPSSRMGTRPAGEKWWTRRLKAGSLKLSFSSSKAIPSCCMSSQGRSDQDE